MLGWAPRSGYFRSKALRLHYLEAGDRSAPLMILLHGGLEHAHAWRRLAAQFATRYRVVCPDLRGHGDSDWSTGGAYSVLDGVYDLLGLFDHLAAGPAILIGHSFGGAIAVRYAALFPEHVSHLAAIEGLALRARPDGAPAADRAVVQRLRCAMERHARVEAVEVRNYVSIEAAAEQLMRRDPGLDRGFAVELATYGLRPRAEGGYVWKYDRAMRAEAFSDITADELRSLWSAISCPTLLVYGAESWATNPALDGRLAFFRNASVVVVPNAGHNVHHHQPEAVAAAMERFLVNGQPLQGR